MSHKIIGTVFIMSFFLTMRRPVVKLWFRSWICSVLLRGLSLLDESLLSTSFMAFITSLHDRRLVSLIMLLSLFHSPTWYHLFVRCESPNSHALYRGQPGLSSDITTSSPQCCDVFSSIPHSQQNPDNVLYFMVAHLYCPTEFAHQNQSSTVLLH